jgi:DNA-binding transcriptional MocR family regulator
MEPTRIGAVIDTIRQRITSRALVPGAKLPSIRGLAAGMQVSPSTVVEAYERLVAEGVIRSHPGSGFYVAGPVAALELAALGPRLERAVDPFWVTRQSLDAPGGMLKPGCGWLPPDRMPEASLRRALRQVARGDAAVLTDYGSTKGAAELRHWLARQSADGGLHVPPDQILLTASGTQTIDLICRLLLRPGDTVVIDDPCYFNFQAMLRAHQVRALAVPYTPEGPDIAAFEQALAQHKPRLYLTNSALHNPTGATLSPQIAHQILRAAAAHDVIIVEDDIFAALDPAPLARLAVLDGLDRVIRIGSFSKTLSASLRCGYVMARADWIEALVDLQLATNFGGPSPLATALLHMMLSEGGYRKHLEQLRRTLHRERQDVAARLDSLGVKPWLMPRGGFYLWCRLPDGKSAEAVARAALAEEVVLAPGNVFSATQSLPDFMRFNVSQMADARIYDVLRRALAG